MDFLKCNTTLPPFILTSVLNLPLHVLRYCWYVLLCLPSPLLISPTSCRPDSILRKQSASLYNGTKYHWKYVYILFLYILFFYIYNDVYIMSEHKECFWSDHCTWRHTTYVTRSGNIWNWETTQSATGWKSKQEENKGSKKGKKRENLYSLVYRLSSQLCDMAGGPPRNQNYGKYFH